MGEPKKGFFDKLKRGLFMTHTEIIEKVKDAMTPDLPIDQAALDGLEEGLLGADVGAELTMALVGRLEQRVRDEKISKMDRLTQVIREETRALIPQRKAATIEIAKAKPFVILVVGVNGTGKTTTIAKLAQRWKNEGKSVVLGAADTFRAAAIEQLGMWADRIGVPLVKHKAGSDPAAVAHDTVSAAKSRGADVVIIDTAGRLHNKSHLMQELSKIHRVIDKELPGAPHETLLVIDGTTGQNGVNQAAAFLEAAKVSGMVVTKLDGTAKGGVILSIMRQFDIPVKFIGVGEGADDLIPFDPQAYVDTLFE
ncbi:MAG: signal recognition particle-docking protein FtsY [Acidobacteria bacterium]|nr:signal recognition particle-docking protein FtsY [Acidobacteriota bacterium]MBV9477902.1 signal recognition particle-docking protein FtsY [Acidobacteriota bacterium]